MKLRQGGKAFVDRTHMEGIERILEEVVPQWLPLIDKARRGSSEDRKEFFAGRELGIPAYAAAVRAVWPEMVAECLKSPALPREWLRAHRLDPTILFSRGASGERERVRSLDFAWMIRILVAYDPTVPEPLLHSLVETMVEFGQVDALPTLLNLPCPRGCIQPPVRVSVDALAALMRSDDVWAAKAVLEEVGIDFIDKEEPPVPELLIINGRIAPLGADDDEDADSILRVFDPIPCAIANHNLELVRYLLTHPRYRPERRTTAYVQLAVKSGSLDILRCVLADGSFDERGEYSWDFNEALRSGRVDLAQAILEAKGEWKQPIFPLSVPRALHYMEFLRTDFELFGGTYGARVDLANRYIEEALIKAGSAAVRFLLEAVFRCDTGDRILEGLHLDPPIGMEASGPAITNLINMALGIHRFETALMLLNCPAFARMWMQPRRPGECDYARFHSCGSEKR